MKSVIRIVIVTFLCGPAVQPTPAFEYRITDLGLGIGWDINENGQLIAGGTSRNSSFFWSDGAKTFLPAGYAFNSGGINDAGRSVGVFTASPGGTPHAFTWFNGVAQDIGTSLGDASSAFAINNAGQIVGQYLLPGGTQTDDYRAYLFDLNTNTMTDLGTLPDGGYTSAVDINDLGQITGTSYVGPVNNNNIHAFIYSNGVMTDVGNLPGATSASVNAINNLGYVVGRTYLGGTSHGLLYDGSVLHDLGAGTEAYDINDLGQIVGADNSGAAIIWDTNRGIRLLEDLIDPMSGWYRLGVAYSINNRGQIVGSGTSRFYFGERAFLLTPVGVPEPQSVALVGFAILGLLVSGFNRRLIGRLDQIT